MVRPCGGIVPSLKNDFHLILSNHDRRIMFWILGFTHCNEISCYHTVSFISALKFCIYKFQGNHDQTSRSTKCWLKLFWKSYADLFVLADAQIAEEYNQTIFHLKGWYYPKLYVTKLSNQKLMQTQSAQQDTELYDACELKSNMLYSSDLSPISPLISKKFLHDKIQHLPKILTKFALLRRNKAVKSST